MQLIFECCSPHYTARPGVLCKRRSADMPAPTQSLGPTWQRKATEERIAVHRPPPSRSDRVRMRDQFPILRAQQVFPASCQHLVHTPVREQIPWQPIRSSSRLAAGYLDRRPDNRVNKHRYSVKKVYVGGMKSGIYYSVRGHLMNTYRAAYREEQSMEKRFLSSISPASMA